MSKALIVCSTNSGVTVDTGNILAGSLRYFGVETTVLSASDIKHEDDFIGYDALVFGSATYKYEVLQSLKKLLSFAEKAKLKGKVGGTFGSASWIGDTPDAIIFEMMNNTFKMDMVSGPLKIESKPSDDETTKAFNYGEEIVSKL